MIGLLPAFFLPVVSAAPGRNLSVVFETFSLPLAEAAALLREQPRDSELHALCVAGLADQSIRQEGLTVIRTLENSVASNSAVIEVMGPTEYEAVWGGSGPLEPGVLPSSLAPVIGVAFETRFFGFELSLEAKSQPGDRVSIRIMPDWTRRGGRSVHGQGIARLTMPEIETQRLKAGIVVVAGKPFLLGTFNRTPESKVEPLSATRVSFAFVTVTPIES